MAPVELNYLAVITAALAAFFLGAIWYSPALFAKAWMNAHGYSEEKVKEMQKSAGIAYGVSVVCYLVMAGVLSVLMDYAGVTTLGNGICIGFLAWLGFAATISLTSLLFSDRKPMTYLIDAGYQLVYLLMMGGILGAWQ